jgi:hypothetical protein
VFRGQVSIVFVGLARVVRLARPAIHRAGLGRHRTVAGADFSRREATRVGARPAAPVLATFGSVVGACVDAPVPAGLGRRRLAGIVGLRLSGVMPWFTARAARPAGTWIGLLGRPSPAW